MGVSSITRIRRIVYRTIKTEITPKDNNRKSKCPEKEIQIKPYKIASTKIFKIISAYSNSLEEYKKIIPCGIKDKGIITIRNIKMVSKEEILKKLKKNLLINLDY